MNFKEFLRESNDDDLESYSDVYEYTYDKEDIDKETKGMKSVLKFLGAKSLNDIVLKYEPYEDDEWDDFIEDPNTKSISIKSEIYDDCGTTKFKGKSIAIFGNDDGYGYGYVKK